MITLALGFGKLEVLRTTTRNIPEVSGPAGPVPTMRMSLGLVLFEGEAMHARAARTSIAQATIAVIVFAAIIFWRHQGVPRVTRGRGRV